MDHALYLSVSLSLFLYFTPSANNDADDKNFFRSDKKRQIYIN